jgi:hypothetical protein
MVPLQECARRPCEAPVPPAHAQPLTLSAQVPPAGLTSRCTPTKGRAYFRDPLGCCVRPFAGERLGR